MARFFSPRANNVARALIVVAGLSVCAVAWSAWQIENSPYVTSQQIVIEQPIPFSHQHHVGQLGIDCRYCHSTVADSSFAGIPPTKTCMTCHSQIWTSAAMLEPVRESWRSGKPIQWVRVNRLPDYVYFDHGIHIAKGVGCDTCHGPVDEMPLMWQHAPLQMSWCMDCHRDPARFLRPREEVFNLHYGLPKNQAELGKTLVERYQIRSPQALIDCSTCHR